MPGPWEQYSAAPAAATPAAGPWANYAQPVQPPEQPTGFLAHLGNTIAGAPGAMVQTVMHPIDALKAWRDQSQALHDAAVSSAEQGDYVGAAAHGFNFLANIVPGLGKVIDDAAMAGGESGITSEEFKSTLGDVVGTALLLKAAEKLPAVLSGAKTAASVVTDPAVVRAAVKILPKGQAGLDLVDAVRKSGALPGPAAAPIDPLLDQIAQSTSGKNFAALDPAAQATVQKIADAANKPPPARPSPAPVAPPTAPAPAPAAAPAAVAAPPAATPAPTPQPAAPAAPAAAVPPPPAIPPEYDVLAGKLRPGTRYADLTPPEQTAVAKSYAKAAAKTLATPAAATPAAAPAPAAASTAPPATAAAPTPQPQAAAPPAPAPAAPPAATMPAAAPQVETIPFKRPEAPAAPPGAVAAPARGLAPQLITAKQFEDWSNEHGLSDEDAHAALDDQNIRLIDRSTLNRTLHAITGDHEMLSQIAKNTYGVKSLTGLSDEQMLELVDRLSREQIEFNPRKAAFARARSTQ